MSNQTPFNDLAVNKLAGTILDHINSWKPGSANQAARLDRSNEPGLESVTIATRAVLKMAAAEATLSDALTVVGNLYMPGMPDHAMARNGDLPTDTLRVGAYFVDQLWRQSPCLELQHRTKITEVNGNRVKKTQVHLVPGPGFSAYLDSADAKLFLSHAVPAGTVPSWADRGEWWAYDEDTGRSWLCARGSFDELTRQGMAATKFADLDDAVISSIDHLASQALEINAVGSEFVDLAGLMTSTEFKRKSAKSLRNARRNAAAENDAAEVDDDQISVSANLDQRISAEQSLHLTRVKTVEAMIGLGSFSLPWFADDKFRLYCRGPVTNQDPFGKLVIAPAGKPGQFNVVEANDVIKDGLRDRSIGGKNASLETWSGYARNAATSVTAAVKFVDISTGAFDAPFWAALRVVDLAESAGSEAIITSYDATCSGGQIASIITRNSETARVTNLHNASEPCDAYLEALAKTLEVCDLSITTADGRKLHKRPTMAVLYGGGAKTAREELKALAPSVAGLSHLADDPAAFNTVVDAMMYGITSTLGAVTDLVAYYREVIEAVGDDWLRENTVDFTTPAGKVYRMSAFVPLSKEGARVKCSLMGRLVYFRPVTLSDRLDADRLARRLFSQLIQGLDALVNARTIAGFRARSGDSAYILSNHDCWAIEERNSEHLMDAFREALFSISKVDWVGRFRAEMELQTGMDLPTAPELGDWDPSELLSSAHCLSN
ncbi:hypothetical protein N9S00_07020 [Luminiphilus sp.]|nr:hypothetical protein [Luminiphilus sp.]